jgi:plastocyanin
MKYLSYLVTSLATALLVIVFSLSGCTSSPNSTTSTQQPTVISQNPTPNAIGTTVKIVDFKYVPDNLKIAVGQTVQFINQDEGIHTVTAKDNTFDSKSLDEKQTWTYTFTKAGNFPYLCSLHPYMKGTISVTETK